MVYGALRVIAAVAVVLNLLVTPGSLAQQPDQPGAAPPQPAATQQPEQPAASPFKPEELDQILAPIALYPDELIVQILTAATYPLEIVMAARWVADPKNAALKGDALAKALEGQSWDASVKSLVPFPSVLKMMSEKLDWTQKLGDAFLSQEADCLASVQSLRRKAAAAGTLKSTPQQKVTVAPRAAAAAAPGLQGPPAGEPITVAPVTEDQTISIAPADPQTVYVPSYDPATAYGSWPYPSYPPYSFPPPAGYGYPLATGLATGLAFGAGVAIVGSLWGWGSPNWGGGNVNINTNQFNSINRTGVSGNTWQHNAAHRQGVAYRDGATRQRYGRETAGAAGRRDYRGFEGRGGAGAGAGRGGGQLAGGAGRAGQPRVATRPAGQGRIGENRGGGQGLQGRAGGQGLQGRGAGSGRAPVCKDVLAGLQTAVAGRGESRTTLGVQSRQWGSDASLRRSRCGKPPATWGRRARRRLSTGRRRWFPGRRPWWQWWISARRRWRWFPGWRPWWRWRGGGGGGGAWRRRPWQMMTFLRAGGARLCPVHR